MRGATAVRRASRNSNLGIFTGEAALFRRPAPPGDYHSPAAAVISPSGPGLDGMVPEFGAATRGNGWTGDLKPNLASKGRRPG